MHLSYHYALTNAAHHALTGLHTSMEAALIPVDRAFAATLADREKKEITHIFLQFLKGDWFRPGYPGENSAPLLLLLVGVYSAYLRDKHVSKKDMFNLMQVDHTRTGPRYLEMAIKLDLIRSRRLPEHDSRKVFLHPSPRLIGCLELGYGGIVRSVARRTVKPQPKAWPGSEPPTGWLESAKKIVPTG